MKTKRYKAMLVWAVFLSQNIASINAGEFQKTPLEIASISLPSITVISIEDEKNGPIASGTGFFIKKNIIVTCAHILRGNIGYVRLVNQKTKYDIMGVVVDDTNDLALIYINGANTTCLKISDRSNLYIAEPIYVIGNPNGFEGSFSMGVVSSILKEKQRSDPIPKIMFNAAISHGSSGSPLLDSHNKVIGIVIGSYSDGQNLNFAVQASFILPLLKKSPIPLYKYSKSEDKKCLDGSNDGSIENGFLSFNLLASLLMIGFVVGFYFDWLSNKFGKNKLSIKTQNYTVHISGASIKDRNYRTIESGSESLDSKKRTWISIYLE